MLNIFASCFNKRKGVRIDTFLNVEILKGKMTFCPGPWPIDSCMVCMYVFRASVDLSLLARAENTTK